MYVSPAIFRFHYNTGLCFCKYFFENFHKKLQFYAIIFLFGHILSFRFYFFVIFIIIVLSGITLYIKTYNRRVRQENKRRKMILEYQMQRDLNRMKQERAGQAADSQPAADADAASSLPDAQDQEL